MQNGNELTVRCGRERFEAAGVEEEVGAGGPLAADS